MESTCEGSVIPGLLAARGEEQHTNTVRISVVKDQSIKTKISAFGTALPTSQYREAITLVKPIHTHEHYMQ